MKARFKVLDQFKGQRIADCQQDLMMAEANIARFYWKKIGACLDAPYNFDKRSRRPALDIFNATLNYLYGMTYTVVEAGIFAAGFGLSTRFYSCRPI